jgi:hypothetical protein
LKEQVGCGPDFERHFVCSSCALYCLCSERHTEIVLFASISKKIEIVGSLVKSYDKVINTAISHVLSLEMSPDYQFTWSKGLRVF